MLTRGKCCCLSPRLLNLIKPAEPLRGVEAYQAVLDCSTQNGTEACNRQADSIASEATCGQVRNPRLDRIPAKLVEANRTESWSDVETQELRIKARSRGFKLSWDMMF